MAAIDLMILIVLFLLGSMLITWALVEISNRREVKAEQEALKDNEWLSEQEDEEW